MNLDHESVTAKRVPEESGKPASLWPWLVLIVILVAAGFLRFAGLNWDEGQYIHPDEGHMRNTLSLIHWPDDLSVYFDAHRSPLNVRNHEGRRYSYGTLPLFATRAAAEWLDGGCGEDGAPLAQAAATVLLGEDGVACRPGAFTGVYSALVGRALSGVADQATLVLVCRIGRRVSGDATGLLSSGMGAVTAFMIQQAHFFPVDGMACFSVTLVALFSVRAGQAGDQGRGTGSGTIPWVDLAVAGVGVGLAAACKVSAATAALLVVLAGIKIAARMMRDNSAPSDSGFGMWRLGGLVAALAIAGLLSLVAFRTAQPYAFEGPGFFGLQPSPEWFSRLREIRMEQAGEVDLPSGRQWANRTPILFPWINIVVWGMGLPLGLAGWIGWGVAGYELLTARRSGSVNQNGQRHLVLWWWFTILFLYQATRWVKSMRYFLPLYPILLLFAAVWLVRLVGSQGRWRRWIGLGLSTAVGLGAILWGIAFFTIYLRPHPRLAASRWIYDHVPAGSTVANEHWDWGLPLRVDGHDPFGGTYAGIEMKNYDEDTPQKRQALYKWLEEADWIFLASNRLYASIPRLPTRYPLTTEYYRALFAGELGFELTADFTSYPALGPFVFPDQEIPFPLMEADYESQRQLVEVRLPPAEEAFSVYDHPRVLMFRKTEAYSSQAMREILGAVDLGRVQMGRTPQEATQAPDMLRFEQDVWAEQQAGGTWSEMFNRDSLLNRYPGLAAVVWWLVVSGLGWLAFPLLSACLPTLRDRGYGLARLVGLLVVAYGTWLAASVHLFPNTRATITRMVALLALVGGGVGWQRWNELKGFVRERWRTIVVVEALFAALFGLWLIVRMLQPDLWHPVVGGEKPMDFAYLNAVMKSTWFPPYNPWLSGTWINYYYFGFVIVGSLIQLVGTVPAVAYNLAVPLVFALMGTGAFSVAYNLAGIGDGERRSRRALLAGGAAVVFTVLVGNLGVIHLLVDKLIAIGDVSFPSTIPGFPNTVSLGRGLWRVIVKGTHIAVRNETWYWHPTRIIPAEAGNPIAEFPAFTFLYGDLHAHMIALPLTLTALALALNWARSTRHGLGSLLLGGLVIGALRPTNTWDYPTYLVLGALGLALGAWHRATTDGRDGWSLGRRIGAFARRAAWQVAVLVGLTVVLYLPYIRHYVTGYSSFKIWQGGATPVKIYLWIWGALLFPVATRLFVRLARDWRGRGTRWGVAALLLGVTAAATVGLVAMGIEVALVAAPLAGLAVAAFLVAQPVDQDDGVAIDEREPGPAGRLLWVLVATAVVLTVAVEVVVLEGDVGRMNTVFKFYLQTWVLLSVSAAASLAWLWWESRRWGTAARRLWWCAMGALILGSALFLPLGIRARALDRMAPETGLTLDGMAFMEDAVIHDGPEGELTEIDLRGDYRAIRWMQEHVPGTPVILEGLGRREYLWANRVSIYTGLPAVAGWRWHQVQQRAGVGGEMVNWRRTDVDLCYSTQNVTAAEDILKRYGVGYIYVGPYERAYYDAAGLDKFGAMAEAGLLTLVYDSHGVKIFKVIAS